MAGANLGSLLMQMELDGVDFLRNTKNVTTALAQIETAAARTGAVVDQGVGGSLVQIYEQARRTSPAVQKAGEDVARMDTRLRQAGAGVRVLAQPLVRELGPALGSVTGQIASVVAGAATLGGGFGAVAFAAVGLAGMLGGALIESFRKAAEEKRQLDRVMRSGSLVELREEAEKAGKSIDDLDERIAEVRRRLETQPKARVDFTPSDAGLLAVLEAERLRRAGERGDLLRTGAQQSDLLNADFTAGAEEAQKIADDFKKHFRDADQTLKAFGDSAALLFAENPLQKMLAAINKEAADLIVKFPHLEEQAKAIAGVKKEKTTDDFFRSQGPGAATVLGLGDTNLFSGFKDIDELERHTQNLTGAFEDMAKRGIPAKDLFPQIAIASDNLGVKLQALREKYAEHPRLLEEIDKRFRGLDFGGFGRQLDAIARGASGASQGFAQIIDPAGQVVTVTGQLKTGFDQAATSTYQYAVQVHQLDGILDLVLPKLQAVAALSGRATNVGPRGLPNTGIQVVE